MTADALISNPPDPYAPGFLSVFNPDGSVAYASYVPKQIGPLTVDSSGQVYTADGSSVTKTDLQLPYVASVLNSASLQDSGQVAPGELITLRGLGLGPRGGVSSQLDANGYVATSLGGTRVMFGGAPTSVLYASDQRVDTVVPFGAQPGSIVQVRVEANGQSSPPLPIKVAAADPAVFALFRGGRGQAAALNQDGTLNLPQNPATRGAIISLFETGGGSFEPPLSDGQITPVPGPALQLPVQVFFHGTPGEVVSASGAPGLVAGVIQINARVPADLPPRLNLDAVDINLSIGTVTSQAAISIAVR